METIRTLLKTLNKKEKHELTTELIAEYNIDIVLCLCENCGTMGAITEGGDMEPCDFNYCERCEVHYSCDNCKSKEEKERENSYFEYLCEKCRKEEKE